jgi:translocator protein
MNNFFKFLAAVVVCEFAGIIGTPFTISAIPVWYFALNKPFFSPPSWIFTPVWITLYFLMGVSLFLVWQKKIPHIFWVQLFLNAIWSIIFFGLKNPLLAFIDIIALWIAIIITIRSFYKISQPAAYLLIPYILWVSFASLLNLFIVILN